MPVATEKYDDQACIIAEKEAKSLREFAAETMLNCFTTLDDHKVTGVYQMVLTEVEAPLLKSVMFYVTGNKTKAAEVVGFNHWTLSKKLRQYGLSPTIPELRFSFAITPKYWMANHLAKR